VRDPSHATRGSGIEYHGFDVVAAVIEQNKARYTAPNVHFGVANIVTDELPAADLLVSKHVLQHLPNGDVAKFIRRLGKYKHVLLVDSVEAESLSAPNLDIEVGEFRPLDPTREPFKLPGRKTLTWWDGYHMHQVVHLVREM
jgi:hypothetical protein